ncbi:hypothetical protein [Spiroplasma endosymbiont of Villa modesta]
MSREWKFERRDFEENQKRIEKEIQERIKQNEEERKLEKAKNLQEE